MQAGFAFSKFATRLAAVADLSSTDLDLLARMPTTIAHYASHQIVLRADQRPENCCLLLQGYLCWRSADAANGQITSVHVPGDIPDLHTIHLARPGAHLSALGSAVVAWVPHTFLREMIALSESMSRALSTLIVADAAALRSWVVNLGSRDALTRVAYLICEIAVRLRAVGLARDLRFASPFTQADLAAACGISPVHANRVIQELRRKELLHWQSRTITITNWDALLRVAEFHYDHLPLRNPDGASASDPGVQLDYPDGLAFSA
jgi:CRP-like cAMP-binding protein